MRIQVCAECHITYYFNQNTGALSIPWEQPPDLNAVVHYFSSTYPYREWLHAMTGARLAKLRHPDYEFFLGGSHSVAGVACADCHMPFTMIGNQKITSHDFASPLSNPSTSCGVCHRQSDDYLRERVRQAQEDVTRLLSQVEEELVRSITMLRGAIGTPGADAEMINRAQELHFRAFLRYDWVFSANSHGFHNPR
ncbi:MAG: ammonia-forming cytochrome c nitrite reductase subunit c552 [Bacillota bacterium]